MPKPTMGISDFGTPFISEGSMTPEGFAEISRWSSAATPPVDDLTWETRILEGCQRQLIEITLVVLHARFLQ